MCENAYLSIKNPKASRALKWALDPGRRMLASLARLRFATSATVGLRSWGPPLDQILDPHLTISFIFMQFSTNFIQIRPNNKLTTPIFVVAHLKLILLIFTAVQFRGCPQFLQKDTSNPFWGAFLKFVYNFDKLLCLYVIWICLFFPMNKYSE